MAVKRLARTKEGHAKGTRKKKRPASQWQAGGARGVQTSAERHGEASYKLAVGELRGRPRTARRRGGAGARRGSTKRL